MTISSSNFADKKTLIILTGPTGVGKTEYAIELAKRLKTEIISCDSRQFYKEMSIGTAAPSQKQLSQVKHHFIQHKSIVDYYNISMFEKDVFELLNTLFAKHSKVIMTGGSGLYIDIICNGIAQLPDADLELRTKLKNEYSNNGLAYIQNLLQKLDFEYFETVDLSNPNRILRALEVCMQTGTKYSEIRKFEALKRPFAIEKICLTREKSIIDQRINARTDNMIKDGLIDEAKSLYSFKGLQALNTVGYKELFSYFDENCSLNEAIEKIKTNTRRYAKRQLTWFRKDEKYVWVDIENLSSEEFLHKLINRIK